MITKQLLKQSYQIVQQDLLNTFQKMKNGDKIRLPNIGVFEKKFKQGKSYLPESYGKKYTAYWVGFKQSQVLKRSLNN